MATTTVQAFRSAFTTALEAQTDADAADVFAYPPGDDARGSEAIYLADITEAQTHLAFGGSRTETYTVTGGVYVRKAGSGDTVAESAETRALELIADVETVCRNSPTTGSVFHSQFGGYDSIPSADPDGRVHLCEFTIDVEAHI